MAGFGDAEELLVLDKVFGAVDFTPPATHYVSLHTADPGESGANEVASANGYARASYTNNATNWPAAASGQKKNANTILFPQASGSWGTVTHFGIWSAASGGTFILGGALGTSKAVATSDQLRFVANAIVITLD